MITCRGWTAETDFQIGRTVERLPPTPEKEVSPLKTTGRRQVTFDWKRVETEPQNSSLCKTSAGKSFDLSNTKSAAPLSRTGGFCRLRFYDLLSTISRLMPRVECELGLWVRISQRVETQRTHRKHPLAPSCTAADTSLTKNRNTMSISG